MTPFRQKSEMIKEINDALEAVDLPSLPFECLAVLSRNALYRLKIGWLPEVKRQQSIKRIISLGLSGVIRKRRRSLNMAPSKPISIKLIVSSSRKSLIAFVFASGLLRR